MIEQILDYIEEYINLKVKYSKGLVTSEELLECRKNFSIALSEYIDFRLDAIVQEQERRYAIEAEARLEAHDRAMAVLSSEHLDLGFSEEIDLLDRKS